MEPFAPKYEANYANPAACLVAHRQPLLTFFAFPAERWTHLLKTNVITSPFATVRLSQRVPKDAASRTKGLLLAFLSCWI